MDDRMKSFLFWSAVCIFLFVGIPIHFKGKEAEVLEKAFQNFTVQYNKSYNYKQYKEKLGSFKRSWDQIEKLNAQEGLHLVAAAGDEEEMEKSQVLLKNSPSDGGDGKRKHHRSHHQWKKGMPKNQGSARWGVTKFADISPDEFKTKYLDPHMLKRINSRQGKNGPEQASTSDNLISRRKRAAVTTDVPLKVDWREKGIVTPVKHQKNCGACWAFSTVEAVESMQALQRNVLTPLSVQQVIDCSKNGNMGCNGGDTCAALSWMMSRKLVPESQYPTTLVDGTCRLQSGTTGVEVAGNYTCENLIGSEKKVISILANHGPVVAAVDATNWQYYVGGVIQYNCDANVNHAVQIVGYDQTATPPHYIVRNSWGPDFGDKGYLYVAIGSNLCGIAREVSAVSVK